MGRKPRPVLTRIESEESLPPACCRPPHSWHDLLLPHRPVGEGLIIRGKLLWKLEYDDIVRSRSSVLELDPSGVFDLLFGAARKSQKIIDLPVRYRSGAYGTTNIQRRRHGWLSLRMAKLDMKKPKSV